MTARTTKKLVINELPIEFHQAFDAFANAFELTRDQALIFLLVHGRVTDHGLEAVISEADIRNEWRETMMSRFFEFLDLK